jgi:ABC-type dipeptide/oligopeptide/nickel transport system permease component
MLIFVGQRILQALPVMFLGSVLIFLLLHLLPGDPALALVGPDATPEIVQAVRQDMGLDQPLPVQYGIWLGNVLRGDLGRSVVSNKLPVAELLARRIPATLELAIAGMIIWVVIGVSTGVIAAVKLRTPTDWLISAWNGLGVAIPGFWFGILTIILFSLVLGWLPPGGRVEFMRDPLLALRYLILPALTLSLMSTAGLSRLVRASMLEVLGEDYVRTARAKGLAERRVLVGHAMRNALVPVITVMGLHFGRLLSGAVVVETIFAWPGVGRLILDSINLRDYAVVQGALLMMVVLYVGINLLVDVAYGFLDPRIRLSGRGSR